MLNVSDLKSAKQFYTALLGQNPTKVKKDYLQWKIPNPALNLSIKANKDQPIGVNHLGIQTEKENDLKELFENASRANAKINNEGRTTCCYANSEKSWATDNDGIEWELFQTFSDSPSYYESASALK
jgi:catechol-2,3-dioxygenase